MPADALPRIAIATGDPAGIGPEVSLKAARDPGVRQICRPLLVGDPAAIELHARACGLDPELKVVREVAQASWSDGAVTVLAAASRDNVALRLGSIDPAYGRASLDAARRAIKAALAREVEAVVAAPQTEKSIALAGIAFDGYPTFVARETGIDARDVYLMLCFDDYRVVNMTLHCSVRDALAMVTRERVAHVIRTTAGALRRMGVAAPRIASAGSTRMPARTGCSAARRSRSSRRRSPRPRAPASTRPGRSQPTLCSTGATATPISLCCTTRATSPPSSSASSAPRRCRSARRSCSPRSRTAAPTTSPARVANPGAMIAAITRMAKAAGHGR